MNYITTADNLRKRLALAGHKVNGFARMRLAGARKQEKAKAAKLLARTLAMGSLHSSLREAGVS